MSNTLSGLTAVKVLDDRANLHEAEKYLFKQPANEVSYQSWPSTASSDSQCSFTVNPPGGMNAITSRFVLLTMQVTAEMEMVSYNNQGVAAYSDPRALLCGYGANGNSNAICLRQFPLASIMQSVRMTLNTISETTEPHRYIHALSRYDLDENRRAYEMSSSPSQPDYYQRYNDSGNQELYPVNGVAVPGAAIGGTAGLELGNGRSPFSAYGENSSEPSRGSYRVKEATYANDKATVTWEITEPVFLSPLTGGRYGGMGLSQINAMSFEFSWDSKRQRIFSVDQARIQSAGNHTRRLNILDVHLNSTSKNRLSFVYLTPQPDITLPQTLNYDYHRYEHHKTDIGEHHGVNAALATPATLSKKEYMNSFTLNCIPARMYVWIRKKEGDRTEYDTDTFGRIEAQSLNMTMGNTHLLNSASEQDLWRMSVDNGLKMSFPEWHDYCGSVLCIDFGRNVGLPPNQCVGMTTHTQIQFDITWSALNPVEQGYELNTLSVLPGVIEVQNGIINRRHGVFAANV